MCCAMTAQDKPCSVVPSRDEEFCQIHLKVSSTCKKSSKKRYIFSIQSDETPITTKVTKTYQCVCNKADSSRCRNLVELPDGKCGFHQSNKKVYTNDVEIEQCGQPTQKGGLCKNRKGRCPHHKLSNSAPTSTMSSPPSSPSDSVSNPADSVPIPYLVPKPHRCGWQLAKLDSNGQPVYCPNP